MAVLTENYGYKREWEDICVEERETAFSVMTDFHVHDFYEISLVLTGEVSVIMSDVSSNGTIARVVLAPPSAPHYVCSTRGSIYSRANVVFSENFLKSSMIGAESVLSVFGEHGRVIPVNTKTADELLGMIRRIGSESSLFRKKLILLYFLSFLADLDCSPSLYKTPSCVSAALDYVKLNYSEKIRASDLAWKLKVGRTTLMTSFKKYTGMTLNNYIVKHRIYQAVELLKTGRTEAETAELCGFGDSTNMIRSFKRELGLSPLKYLDFVQERNDDTVKH